VGSLASKRVFVFVFVFVFKRAVSWRPSVASSRKEPLMLPTNGLTPKFIHIGNWFMTPGGKSSTWPNPPSAEGGHLPWSQGRSFFKLIFMYELELKTNRAQRTAQSPFLYLNLY